MKFELSQKCVIEYLKRSIISSCILHAHFEHAYLDIF